MDSAALLGTLEFLRGAEQLKNVTRTSWTSTGARENVAAHSWRLALMAVVFAPEFPGIDVARLLRMCVIHDLGEAIGGDISATLQPAGGKSEAERRDLLQLLAPLPPSARQAILELWDEYEAGVTPEARLAKALDKLETILQHNQGLNPPGFDYPFNLGYGRAWTESPPLVAELRRILDAETAARGDG